MDLNALIETTKILAVIGIVYFVGMYLAIGAATHGGEKEIGEERDSYSRIQNLCMAIAWIPFAIYILVGVWLDICDTGKYNA